MIGICEDLRKAVLQAAIQGKLTEQLESDGNAETLYAEIQQEKQRLIKERKIKKEKELEPIDLDEVPFDIPNNWKWVRLTSVLEKLADGSHNPPPKVKSGYRVISARNIKNGKIEFYDDDRFADLDGFLKENGRTRISSGDVILGIIGGSIGNTAIYDHSDSVIAQRSIAVFNSFMSNRYLKVLLDSLYIQSKFLEKKSGSAQDGVYLNTLSNLIVPLPPLAEQHRIVAKVDELMAKIDEMEKTEKSLNDLYNAFPGDMKASILQAAIQGKLTEQLPSDGDAETLYAEIQDEKKRLIKEGKIKKEKELEPIDLDEVPFDIPGNWKWVRLGEVFAHNTGKALNQRNEEGSLMSYITTSNLYWDGFILDDLRSMRFTDSEIEKCTVKKGDLLVCEGGDIGRSAIWPYDYEMRIQNHIHKLRAYKDVCTEFYWYVLYLLKLTELIGGKGIGIQGLSSNALHMLLIPLPPLAEQKRIVEKLDQLLPLCDKIKDSIQE
ncbi:MAG: restriction endonuclease subunit S [Spirochaetales bacterium]|nr:restriction endonuclease subunit S [Spirochaetales bacterium]